MSVRSLFSKLYNKKALDLLTQKPKTRAPRSKGFTLIEVMVSIAIFSGLSIAAYQVLNQTVRSNALSLEKTTRLTDIQRVLVIMDADFRQMATRRFHHGNEVNTEQLLYWKDGLNDSNKKGILFTRLGWFNPQQEFPRGEVVKVGYRIQDDTFERVWWPYPDTPSSEEPLVRKILTKVSDFEASFYIDGSWKDTWDKKNTLPNAIKITLELDDFGKIDRIYLIGTSDISAEKSPETKKNTVDNNTNQNTDNDPNSPEQEGNR